MVSTFHSSRPYLDPLLGVIGIFAILIYSLFWKENLDLFYVNLAYLHGLLNPLNTTFFLLPLQTILVQLYVNILLYPSSIAPHARPIRFQLLLQTLILLQCVHEHRWSLSSIKFPTQSHNRDHKCLWGMRWLQSCCKWQRSRTPTAFWFWFWDVSVQMYTTNAPYIQDRLHSLYRSWEVLGVHDDVHVTHNIYEWAATSRNLQDEIVRLNV